MWPEKFDFIIANPPYGSGTKKLDIKFLDKALDICKGEIIFVHPSSQYVDGKGRNKLYNEINNKILKNLTEVDFFNGNGIFGISMAVPCVITSINTSRESNNIRFIDRINKQNKLISKFKIEEISIFGHNENFNSIKNKILKYKDSKKKTLKEISTVIGFSGDQKDKMYLKNKDSFFVEVSHIQGASNTGKEAKIDSRVVKDNFFIMLNGPSLIVKHGGFPKYRIWFEFITKEEAHNFIFYCKTNFFRMCLSLVKTNKNIAQNELSYIPAVDFTQEWTDEKLYKEFNITEEEQAFIKEIIPKYYD